MKQQPAVRHTLFRREEIPGGWEGLAMAVVFQACEDYRAACRARLRHPDSRKAAAAVRQLERFFSSAWFHTLTDLDGRHMIQQIREEAE